MADKIINYTALEINRMLGDVDTKYDEVEVVGSNFVFKANGVVVKTIASPNGDLSNYYTKAETTAQITSQVSTSIASGDLKTALDSKASQTALNTANSNISALQTEMVNARGGYSDLDARLDTLSSGGSTPVVDNLTSTSTTSALSANQGKAINDNLTTNYYNKTQTDSQIATGVSNAVTNSGTLKTALDSKALASDLTTTNTNVTTLQTEITNARGGSVDLDTRLDNIDTTIFGKEPIIAIKNSAFNVDFETTATNIKMNGVQSLGSLSTVARVDHVHPSDASKVDVLTTVNSKDLSSNVVLTGEDILTTGYAKALAQASIGTTDSINSSLGKLEKKVDDVIFSDSLRGVYIIDNDRFGITNGDLAHISPYTNAEYLIAHNNKIGLQNALDYASSQGYSECILKNGTYIYLYEESNSSVSDYTQYSPTGITIPSNMTFNMNGSTIRVIYDSNNKNPYDLSQNSATNPIYNLPGIVFYIKNCENGSLINGNIKGDRYERAFTDLNTTNGEHKKEQTYGVRVAGNGVYNFTIKNMKIHGFMGDSVSSDGFKGTYKVVGSFSAGNINNDGTTGTIVNSYTSAFIDITGFDRYITTTGGGYTRIPTFVNSTTEISWFKSDNTFISKTPYRFKNYVTKPYNATKMKITIYDETNIAGVNTNIIYVTKDSSRGLTISDCYIYDNHRGGVSNIIDFTTITKSFFYNNGKGVESGFPLFYDTTRYHINAEDYVPSKLVIEDNDFYNGNIDLLISCAEGCINNNRFNNTTSNVLIVNESYDITFSNNNVNAFISSDTYELINAMQISAKTYNRKITFTGNYITNATILQNSTSPKTNIIFRSNTILSQIPNITIENANTYFDNNIIISDNTRASNTTKKDSNISLKSATSFIGNLFEYRNLTDITANGYIINSGVNCKRMNKRTPITNQIKNTYANRVQVTQNGEINNTEYYGFKILSSSSQNIYNCYLDNCTINPQHLVNAVATITNNFKYCDFVLNTNDSLFNIQDLASPTNTKTKTFVFEDCNFYLGSGVTSASIFLFTQFSTYCNYTITMKNCNFYKEGVAVNLWGQSGSTGGTVTWTLTNTLLTGITDNR